MTASFTFIGVIAECAIVVVFAFVFNKIVPASRAVRCLSKLVSGRT
jgi:hypothetical protein